MKNAFAILDPRMNHQPEGSFITAATPVISWRLESDRPNLTQKAWQITVTDDSSGNVWTSRKIFADTSAEEEATGLLLHSRQKGTWKLTVWDDQDNQVSTEPIPYETTLLCNEDWMPASWIFFDGNNLTTSSPAPFFRKIVQLKDKPAKARLYITARGLFQAHINGQKIGNDAFTPGWTDFRKEVQFLTYDVTGQLTQGKNALGVILGDGWYCGRICRARDFYGKNGPELLLVLEITFPDGSTKRIVSDETWHVTTGPILASDIYDGEFYNARLELPGWNTVDFKEHNWRKAIIGQICNAPDAPLLAPKICEPVRAIKSLKPARILHPRNDTWIWDFGQNITGNVRIHVGGHGMYTIRFAEMLYDDNTLYTLNYRSAISTDHYYCWNQDGADYEPTFTFHGFRYVQIDGFQFLSFPLEKIDVTAFVYSSDLPETGSFSCGNPKLNQLYSNVCWGQIGNFLEIPTDCPQRDERLGWTGDAEVFCHTAACNSDVLNFFRKYTRDIREAQRRDGAVASVAPDILTYAFGAAAWADAAVICPWTMYERYGSKLILKENFSAMRKWIDFMRKTSNDLIRPKTFYADWLAFSTVETPSQLIGTAYFFYTTTLFVKAAQILGETKLIEPYAKLADGIAEAFRKTFVGDDGLLNVRSQTALVLALHFNLLLPEQRKPNADCLAQLVRENGNRITTGFVGTANINNALSETGHTDTALDLYLQEEFPSWLFSVNQGATTMWERWNSYSRKDGFGPVAMNSFNHYAFGAIHSWVVDTIAGIRFTAPAGKELLFKCQPDPRIGHARATLMSPYGFIESAWKLLPDGSAEWTVTAPVNTRPAIQAPDGWSLVDAAEGPIMPGTHSFIIRPEAPPAKTAKKKAARKAR